jgi:ubiquitin C-terminal hydrolase
MGVRPKSNSPAFDEDVLALLFSTKVPKINFATLSAVGASLVDHLFKYLNCGTLEFHVHPMTNVESFVVKSQKFEGLDYIWRLAVESESTEVGASAIDLLTKLQQNISPLLEDQLPQIREEYVQRAMNYLGEYGSSHSADNNCQQPIQRCLQILQKFIDLFATTKSEKHGSAVSRGNMINLSISVLSGPTIKVEMFDKETIGDLKTKVAKQIEAADANAIVLIQSRQKFLDDTRVLIDIPDLLSEPIFCMKNRPSVGSSSTPGQAASAAQSSKPAVSSVPVGVSAVTILSSEVYFKQLFKLLSLPHPISEGIWDIIMRLPTNIHMKALLTDIQSDKVNNWNEILDPSNCFALYYGLQIVDSLAYGDEHDSAEKKQEKLVWHQKFIACQGLNHLVSIFQTTDFLSVNFGSKRYVCFALLLRVLSFFLFDHEGDEKAKKLNTKIIGEIGIDSKITTKKLVDLIYSIASDNNLLADLNNNESNPSPTTATTSSKKKEVKNENEDVFSNCLILLAGFVASYQDCLSFLLAYPQLESWLELVLITSPLSSLKQVISDKLFQISLLSVEANSTLFSHFDKLLKKSNLASSKCYHFFVLFGRLIAEKHVEEQQIGDLLTYFYDIIKSLPVTEKNSCSAEDEFMNGLMEVSRAIVATFPVLKEKYGDLLIHEIFYRNLFEMPTLATRAQEGQLPPPRCKVSTSRKIAFSFVQELASHNAANLVSICTKALEFQKSVNYQSSWSYLPQAHEKTYGYTGLENLGATCYMNSLMQQFFMNDAFRDRLLAVKKEETDESSMLYQLKTIFVNLLESEKSYYNPKSFCKVYKVDGEPMKTGVQMDVDEFFNMIMERIEQYLKGTNEEKMLNHLFGGEVVNQIISQECEHKVERTEPFLTVQIEVKGKNSVYESLDLFIQDDILDGDNKYECSKCKTKVNARKRCCINQLPNNLILHLKRFDFDLEFLRRSKITRSIEFPLKLNIEPYTKEGLERKEANLPSVNPHEYYDYVLTGILVHTGTTDSGHYYSFIKDRKNDTWSKFNDETVSPFNVENIPETCYGGEYTTTSWDNQLQRQVSKSVSRPNSAYMLFYERVQTQNQLNTATPKDEVIATCQQIYEKVWEENLKFMVDKNLFEDHHVDFVQYMTSLAPKEEVGPLATLENIENHTMKVLELGITFLIQTYSHAKKKDSITEFADQICSLLKVHAPTSQWLLSKVSSDAMWLRELFFYCSDKKVREELIRVFIAAITKISSYESEFFLEEDKISDRDAESSLSSAKDGKNTAKDNIDDPSGFTAPIISTSNSLTKLFINKLFSLYIEARSFWRHFEQYWQLFEEVARVNSCVRSYMISKGYIRALLHFYLQEESPYYNGKASAKTKANERQPNENGALSNMKHLLTAVAVMVSGCSIDRQTENAPPSPVSLEDITAPIFLPQEDEKIFTMKFLLRILSDGNNPEALQMLITHLCWENQNYTDMFIDATYAGINRDTSERFPGYWPVIKSFILLNDSLQEKRTHAMLSKLIDVINQNLGYPHATLCCLVFIVDQLIALNSPLILNYFLHNRKWMKWILFHFSKHDSMDAHENVRFQAEKIVLALVPEALSYVTLKPKEGSPTEFEDDVDDENVYPSQELSVTSKLNLNIILDELMNMFKDPLVPRDMCNYEKPKSHGDDVVSKDGFRLASLFRLLEWTFVGEYEKTKFISDPKVKDAIFSIYKSIEKKEIENDYNKHFFFKLWDRLTDNHEASTNYFANSAEWCGAWISLRPSPLGYNYINKSLFHFYRVLWKASIISDWFRQTFMAHSNFSWAFEFLYIKDHGNCYSVCSEYLMKMFEMYCQDKNFRILWATKYLKLGMEFRHKCWSKVFKTTKWILEDEVEAQIAFCKDGGLDNLIIALAKRESTWTPDDLTEILEVLKTAISWFVEAQSAGQTQLLNQILELKQKALLPRLVDLLPFISQEISHVGKLIHSILKDIYQVNDNAKFIILDKLSLALQHDIEPFNPKNDEWIAEHYISICELCSATPVDGDEAVVDLISDLVVILLVKSLNLDNPFVTLRLLQLLMSLPEDSYLNKPQVIEFYTGLTTLHYLSINENEAILFKFISFLADKFGTFIPELSEDSLGLMKSNWNKLADFIIEAISLNQKELPEDYIKALITVKQAFGSTFQIEREKLDELNNLITKFSNESQAKLVEQWNELYKFL